MRFHFLLTNHYPYGLYRIEDHVKLIGAGLAELGHKVTYGFRDDVAPWPAINLLVEFFNGSPVTEQVIGLKNGNSQSGGARYAFGLICHEDLQDESAMDQPNFPLRRAGLEQLLKHVDFAWTVVPSDYSGLDGGDRVRFLEYGYAPTLRRPDVLKRDIGVLFYGDLGPRRLPLYNALVQRGVSVSATFGMLPGYVKNDLLDRSRIVVDIRRVAPVRFLNPSRICTALHAGTLVVSERIDNGKLSSLYQYTLPVEFDQLIEVCVGAAGNEQAVEAGAAARELFAQNTSMATNLKRVMDLPVFGEAEAG
jgi:hypothetical protein